MIADDRPDEGQPGIMSEWIVCLDSLRDVADGMVTCPLTAGRLTTLEDCLGCRHLAALSNDRSPGNSCSTGEQIS